MSDTVKFILEVPAELYADLAIESNFGYVLNTYRKELETAFDNRLSLREVQIAFDREKSWQGQSFGGVNEHVTWFCKGIDRALEILVEMVDERRDAQ